jgi:DNA-binding transcriptional regulator YdaS (Cro superfamily)
MNLKKWLKQVRGRAKAMAAETGFSRGAISQWMDAKKGVPKNRRQTIYRFTGGEVGHLDMLSERDLAELLRIHPDVTPEIARAAYEAGK